MPFGKPTEDVEAWKFPARLNRVVDGDTVDLTVDLGFSIRRTTRFRLFGVDTAEVYGVPEDSDEFRLGAEHREFVRDWFAAHGDGDWPYVAWTAKDTGKYGRYIVELIHHETGESLNQALVDTFGDVAEDED